MLIGGTSASNAAWHFDVHRSTIRCFQARQQQAWHVVDRPPSGRPRKTSRCEDNYIITLSRQAFYQAAKSLVKFKKQLVQEFHIEQRVIVWGLQVWEAINHTTMFNLCYRTSLSSKSFTHSLTRYQTSPGFYVSAVYVFWKHSEKRRNCSKWAISPFPTGFSTRLESFLPFSSNLKLSSANSFSLEESKICCLGKC